jgi:hypothetical protein
MNRTQSVEYNPSTSVLDISTLRTIGRGMLETRIVNMISRDKVSTILKEHPLLSQIDWDNGNIVLAGGYVSRLLCGDTTNGADIDLFMYGNYSRSDLKVLTSLIRDTYDNIT